MRSIYILSLCLDAGGVEKAICLLANSFAKKEFDITIVNVLNSAPLLKLDESVKVVNLTKFCSDKSGKHSFCYRVLRKILSRKKLIYFIKKINNAVIISTRNEYTVLLSKYGNDTQLRIAQLHHDHKFDVSLLNDFKFRYQNIDYFVHLSSVSRDEITEIMKPYNKRTKNIYIPNFVKISSYNDKIKKENFIISVGRFSSEKGFLRLIDIWNEVEDKKNYKLLLIGDGPEKEEILRKIKTYNLCDSVVLTGFLDNKDVLKYMSISKIYVLPSYTEAFPFVLIEAMQNKLALLAFDVRIGPKVLIQDSFNGFLIPDGEIKLFANKLQSLMQNEEVTFQLANNGFLESKKYDEDMVIKEWIKVMESKK